MDGGDAMTRTRVEQETVLLWDRAEQMVRISATDPATWRKLARLGITPTEETRDRDGKPSTKFYRLPLSEFRWGRKAKRGSLSADRRTRQGAVLAAARLLRKQKTAGEVAPGHISPSTGGT